MPLTAGTVIETARDVHPAFEERRVPARALLRQLSAYHKELVGKVAHMDESAITATATFPFPSNTFPSLALPAYDYLRGATLRSGTDHSDTRALVIIPWAARKDPGPFPSAWIDGANLVLQGRDLDWGAWDQLEVEYVPNAPDLTALSSTFLVPDTALGTLAAHLARFMARRGHMDPALPPIPLSLLEQQAHDAEEAFLRDIFLRRGAQTIVTREVR